MPRILTYASAIREATEQLMIKDKRVFVIGEGVSDPKGIFGTTLGLSERFGRQRVIESAVAESSTAGICIGASLLGLRPILTHQRVDFSLLSFDQLVNNAAKWYYMFGSKAPVPLVIRMIIGRGWGQGSQHSQSLQAIFAHIPGLKVIMPVTPYDVKGLLISAVFNDNPVIFIEHRWLYNLKGYVPEGIYKTPLGKGKIMVKGDSLTVVAVSYTTVESLKAISILKRQGLSIELIDLRSIKPWDEKLIIDSVKKTGRLLVIDTGHISFGIGGEIVSKVTRSAFSFLKQAPEIIALPDVPTPTSYRTAQNYYPGPAEIGRKILTMLSVGKKTTADIMKMPQWKTTHPNDIPDPDFTGPF
ncbi:alpha-ketoacid dehydrogenase subunit beta [Candidatus Gottesmanbacteria bacterium]|nr:alpha-ketoacid dehydrogenase subunit beta [Candidatus Gottesmanbacteria bacterium]